MDYTTIKIETSIKDSCITEEFLYLAGISGWLEEENGDKKTITIYLPQDESGELKFKTISEGLKNIESKTDKTILKAEDWENDWKKNFKALKIGKIIITPPWENPIAENDEKIITIEPGMAFGTGDHATTSSCIELIQKHLKKDMSMIDLGTGSAILSMVGALIGGKRITGIDNDPIATTEAKRNIERMNLSKEIEIITGDAMTDVHDQYELAVANLFLYQVKDIIKSGLPCLKKGGIFIGSGITIDQEEEAKEAVDRSENFEMIEVLEKGLWIAFAAKKIK